VRKIPTIVNSILIIILTANFLAFDVVGSFAFGEPFGFLTKGYDHMDLISTMDQRGEVLNALGTVPVWIRPFMKYVIFDSFWYNGLRATSSMGKFGTEAYHRRKKNLNSRKDFLTFMFSAKDPETEAALPEREIIAESISFIAGGSDTTSSTITNFIDIVSRNSQAQKNLQAELDEAFHGEQSETWVADDKTIQSLPVLNATLREVIRVRPTSATGLERVTPKGGKSICGTYIPEGVSFLHLDLNS
jgi:benzoate 4-monooxygenase